DTAAHFDGLRLATRADERPAIAWGEDEIEDAARPSQLLKGFRRGMLFEPGRRRANGEAIGAGPAGDHRGSLQHTDADSEVEPLGDQIDPPIGKRHLDDDV